MTKPLTSEQKLRAIIERQGSGGYVGYCPFVDGRETLLLHGVLSDDTGFSMLVLPILLDTQGSKAAYGDEIPNDTTTEWWGSISHNILDAWHSEEGNNWQKAIDVAYSFLPIRNG